MTGSDEPVTIYSVANIWKSPDVRHIGAFITSSTPQVIDELDSGLVEDYHT